MEGLRPERSFMSLKDPLRASFYCKDWCLTLNINKTKIIIFNKTGRLIKDNFILDGQEIDCITRYMYLGIMIF
jgi:hypothetical protein